MASFATISVRFNADLKQFNTQMKNVQNQMQKVGKQMTSVGKNLTVGVTAPIVALGYKSVQSWDIQAKAIAQVEAGLKSTGNAVGFTSKQLQNMASDLQNNSLFGDEEILQGATAQLLTFTNIAGEQFSRTQQAALDLATRLDGDLKSSSIQLGKALNDPVANLSALSRSGIQFSKEQKATINALVETNRLADAQTIILDELEKQYGGAAEAAAKAGTGGLTQLFNIIGDIGESFGEIIMEYLNPFIAKIKDLALRFNNLDKSTKTIIAVIAGLAAAIGPVLLTLGALSTTVIPALIAGFTVLMGPIGLVVAALAGVGVVIYKYWDPIKDSLRELQNYFIDLYNESIAFRVVIESIVITFQSLYNVGKLIFSALFRIIETVGRQIKDVFSSLGQIFEAVMKGNFSEIPQIIARGLQAPSKNIKQFLSDVSDDVDQFGKDMETDVGAAMDRIKQRKRIEVSAEATLENVDVTKVEPVSISVQTGDFGRGVSGAISGLAEALKPIQQGPLDLIAPKMEAQVDEMTNQQMRLLDRAIEFRDAFAEIIEQTVENFAIGFAEMIGNAAQGGLSLGGAFNMILVTLADLAINVGKIAITTGTAIEALKQGLTSLGGFGAIAAGVALIAIGTAAKTALSKSVQPFADGGIVSGPTLGIMGEYAGARSNPEVIAPLDKLKGMISDVSGDGGGGKLTAEISGQKLRFLLNRAEGYRNRRG